MFQTEAYAALRLLEPGGLEDRPVLSAPCGPLALPAGSGQQHLREAHLRGAPRTLHQALQEEGTSTSPTPSPDSQPRLPAPTPSMPGGGQVVRQQEVCSVFLTGCGGGCLFQAHLHHYLQVDGVEQGCFTEAVASLSSLIEEYSQLDATKGHLTPDTPRLNMAS